MWWLIGDAFVQMIDAQQVAALLPTAPANGQPKQAQRRPMALPSAADLADGLLTLSEIAAMHDRSLSTIKLWSADPDWPEPIGKRGKWNLYPAARVAGLVRARTQREVQPSVGQPDELLDINAAAAEAGISHRTLRADLTRGRWPEPDDESGGTKRWKRSTVIATMAGRRAYRRKKA